jgi:protocatechuate 3,4-dioxygenase beta subunit
VLTRRNILRGLAATAPPCTSGVCDRDGAYSLYSDGVTEENYLRGAQIAGGKGVVKFSGIFPACCPAHWPHIHFEIYPDQPSITDATSAIATSQVAPPEGACNTVNAPTGTSHR